MHNKSLKPLPSFRRVASGFRLKKGRDDHTDHLLTDMVRVFIPSPLMHGGDIGVYGAPCVVLRGYRLIDNRRDNRCNSVEQSAEHHVVGRMVELHPEELARLDQVAEHAGNFHRFLAEVVGPATGDLFSCWVFQDLAHSTRVERSTSATELPSPAKAQLKLIN